MNDYKEFLKSKRHSTGDFGFNPCYIPDIAFDFQKEIITRATKKGRIAVFADSLAICERMIKLHDNKRRTQSHDQRQKDKAQKSK